MADNVSIRQEAIRPRRLGDGLFQRFHGMPLARRIMVVMVILLGVLHVGNGLLLVHFYASTAAREREARDARATLLAEHAARAISAIDLSLATIVEKLTSSPNAGEPSVFVQLLLNDHIRRLPQVRAIIVLDQDGFVVQDSRDYPPHRRNLSDRPYFAEQQKWRGVGLYIDRAAHGRRDGKMFFGVSRPLLDSDGNFRGVVAAVAEPAYFSSFYGSHEPDRNEVAILARDDGAILAAAASGRGMAAAPGGSASAFLSDRLNANVVTRPVPSFPLRIIIAAPSPIASPAIRAFFAADMTVMAVMTLVALWLTRMLAREADGREIAEIRLRDAIENAPAGFALYDAKDRLVLSNELYRSLFFSQCDDLVVPGAAFEGLMRAPVASGNCADVESAEAARAIVARRLEKHLAADGELVQKLADGRWVLTRERRTNESGVVCFHTDITPMKRQEEALRESEQAERAARERAEEADRAKSAFLATMSHELRTPLNAIIGFSEIIEQALFGTSDVRYREYGTFIRKSGQHLLSIINDILDIAKLQSGKTELHPELIDVDRVIGESIRLVAKQAHAADIVLIRQAEDGLPPVHADAVRLRQILLNLVSNALKFTPRGGKVLVNARQENGFVRIDVSDTGIGMSGEDILKALEPFGQVDNALTRRHEGTGLGLPLAKSLVELHGGRFEIASVPGTGTTISIFFPAIREKRGEGDVTKTVSAAAG